MRQALLKLATVISFGLFLMTASAWFYFGRLHIGGAVAPTLHTQFAAMAVERCLVLQLNSVPYPISGRMELQRKNLSIGRDPLDGSDVGESINGTPSYVRLWTVAQFSLRTCVFDYTSRSGSAKYQLIKRDAFVPYWMLIILFASMPTWRFFVSRRQRVRAARVMHGQCVRCGYDLRATPDRCPECGMVPQGSS